MVEDAVKHNRKFLKAKMIYHIGLLSSFIFGIVFLSYILLLSDLFIISDVMPIVSLCVVFAFGVIISVVDIVKIYRELIKLK